MKPIARAFFATLALASSAAQAALSTGQAAPSFEAPASRGVPIDHG